MSERGKWLSPLEPANLPLSAPGGGEGRGEVGDSRAVAGTHLILPIAEAMGLLPLPREGRRGLLGAAAGHPHTPRRESGRPREWGALGCLLFVLCGPAPSGHWVKPSAGAAQAARVYGYCRARAEAAFRSERDVDQDILATRGSDWQRAGTLSSERSQMGAEAAGRADAIIAGCMRAHGFARAG